MADDIGGMSYERALAELDQTIARLERGDVELDAAIAAYERGAGLARRCAELLDRTEQKITEIVVVGQRGEAERPMAPPRGRDATAARPGAPAAGAALFDEPTAAGSPPGDAADDDDIPF